MRPVRLVSAVDKEGQVSHGMDIGSLSSARVKEHTGIGQASRACLSEVIDSSAEVFACLGLDQAWMLRKGGECLDGYLKLFL